MLTYKEFELLQRFLLNPGEVFSREQLYSEIWGGKFTDQSRTVDIHVRTLRKKLGDSGKLIESVRYIGYRMKKHPEKFDRHFTDFDFQILHTQCKMES